MGGSGHKRLFAFLVIAAAGLSGCTFGPSEAEPAKDDSVVGVQWSATTGAIAGTLVDSSLLPVAGANVTLDDAADVSVSSAAGEFGFSFVEPGAHQLRATADGFATVITQVDVEAGEVARVNIETEPVAGNVSYHETFTESGRIGCSLAVWQPTTAVAHNQPVGLCVLIEPGFSTAFPIDSIEDVSGFWIETTWESTQVAGDGFTTFWPFGNESGRSYIGIFNGSSPLSDPVPPSVFEAFIEANGRSRSMCAETGCRLDGWHYTYANTLDNAYPVDFAVQVDQSYDDYVTVFHGSKFPDRFTALPDA